MRRVTSPDQAHCPHMWPPPALLCPPNSVRARAAGRTPPLAPGAARAHGTWRGMDGGLGRRVGGAPAWTPRPPPTRDASRKESRRPRAQPQTLRRPLRWRPRSRSARPCARAVEAWCRFARHARGIRTGWRRVASTAPPRAHGPPAAPARPRRHSGALQPLARIIWRGSPVAACARGPPGARPVAEGAWGSAENDRARRRSDRTGFRPVHFVRRGPPAARR
jgi:hypothetical protein